MMADGWHRVLFEVVGTARSVIAVTAFLVVIQKSFKRNRGFAATFIAVSLCGIRWRR